MIGKADIIDVIAATGGVTKHKAAMVYDALGETLAAAIHNRTDVSLFGLAKMSVGDLAAKVGRNPKTGEPVQIPARKKLKIKPLAPAKDILERAA